MSYGCVSIPTYKVTEAKNGVEKVNVWTSQVIVTRKFFVIDATPEKFVKETVRATLYTLTSLTEFVERLIIDPEMVRKECVGVSV
jgi:hypothetical protein